MREEIIVFFIIKKDQEIISYVNLLAFYPVCEQRTDAIIYKQTELARRLNYCNAHYEL